MATKRKLAEDADGPRYGMNILLNLEPETIERAEALESYVKTLPAYRDQRESRATVLRAAIERGLADLERAAERRGAR